MNRLERLRAQLAEAEARHNELRASLLELAERSDPFDAETTERWTAENVELDELRSSIPAVTAEITQVEAILASAEAKTGERVGLTFIPEPDRDSLRFGAEYGTPAEVRSNALRAVEQAPEISDRHRAGIEHTIRTTETPDGRVSSYVIATTREAYRSAFAKSVFAGVAGRQAQLTDDESRAMGEVQLRAASLTGNAGGFAIPTPLDPTLILTGDHDGDESFWRSQATIKSVTTNTWTGTSTAGVTSRWGTEASEVGDNAPTLAQPTIDAKKADTFIPFSIEVEQDWTAMEADMRELIMVAKNDHEAAAFAASTATTNGPIGLIFALDGTASEVAPATGEVFALADVYALYNSLPRRFRRNAQWVMEVSTGSAIRQFDTAGGAALWETLANGQPNTLLGRPVQEEPFMRGAADINAAATADNYVLLLGDLRKYYIVDRIGMAIEAVPHLFATGNNRPSGQRGLYAHWRVGADSIDDNAFRVLNVVTAA